MESKKIIQCLVLALIISLSFAAIYATETGEINHNNTSSDQNGIHISGSNNITDIMGSVSPIQHHAPATLELDI
ncbi:hypothetical protein [Methanobrevibacter sp.]|uniref:hypothetical protein n=1 Tax=Methanobrevibacter sp. TaxID=66852 RepID=UPI00388EDB49